MNNDQYFDQQEAGESTIWDDLRRIEITPKFRRQIKRAWKEGYSSHEIAWATEPLVSRRIIHMIINDEI